jgi:hypothetical protein
MNCSKAFNWPCALLINTFEKQKKAFNLKATALLKDVMAG